MSLQSEPANEFYGSRAYIKPEKLTKIKKILVCQLRQLGDVIVSTPALELLKRRFPEASIDFFTEKKCLPLLENNPHLNIIWPLDKKQLSSFTLELGYYWGIAKNNYDLIVDFQQLPRSRWLSLFSPKAIKLSFSPPWYNRFFYSHWIEPIHGYAGFYKASILRPLGISEFDVQPKVYLLQAELDAAKQNLQGMGLLAHERFITVDPTHLHATRRWNLEHYAKLLVLMAQQEANLKFLPLYGPGEEPEIKRLVALCDEIEAGFSQKSLLLTDKMLNLRELGAVISQATMHIGNCSSPRHMAVAVETPSLTVLGSTSSGWTFPSAAHIDISAGLPCQPCNSNSCQIAFKCLNELLPEQVLARALEHFSLAKSIKNLI